MKAGTKPSHPMASSAKKSKQRSAPARATSSVIPWFEEREGVCGYATVAGFRICISRCSAITLEEQKGMRPTVITNAIFSVRPNDTIKLSTAAVNKRRQT